MTSTSEKSMVALLIAAYIIIAVVKITHPGIHFDEAIHVNAAIGGIDRTFIFRQIDGWPLLLMPYVGALKSYLTAPIFAWFGVSPLTIRLPMILYAALGLLLFYLMAKKIFDRPIALLSLLLLALDPSFISLTRVDFGPVVLAFVARTAALLFFWYLVKKHRLKYLLLLLLALALGLYHKLDFIWFINGILFATAIVYFKEIKKALNKWRAKFGTQFFWRKALKVSTLLLGLGILAGYYLLISRRFNLFGALKIFEVDLASRSANVFSNLKYQLNGELFYNNAFGFLHTLAGRLVYWSLGLVSLLGLLGAIFDPLKKLKHKEELFFMVLLFIAILSQIFLTKTAVWPWHTFATYPAVTLIISYGFYTLFIYLKELIKKPRLAAILVALPVLALTGYNLWFNGQYIRVYDQPLYKVYWANRIYDLVDYTQVRPEKFVSIDWGTHNQLIVLTGQKNKYLNPSFRLNNKKLSAHARQEIEQEYFSDPANSLFILHSSRGTLFKPARQNFFEIARDQELWPKKIKEFSDGQQIIFEIYRLERLP